MATEHLIFTPWHTQPPARPGWYVASAERNPARRSFYDGTTWSALVEADASDDAHEVARGKPLHPAFAAAIYWRGLTKRSAQWLAAELAR